MPGQHGQTYDPNEEPAPRGGWFAFVERPFPERVDRASRWVAGVVGVVVAAATAWMAAYHAQRPPVDAADYVLAACFVIGAAAMAYGFTRGVGMVLVGIYATARHGSEFTVDWRALRHDLPLRRVQILLAEAALLLAAAGISLWGFVLFAREGLFYGLAVCVVVQAMTYWPAIRRRMQGDRRFG